MYNHHLPKKCLTPGAMWGYILVLGLFKISTKFIIFLINPLFSLIGLVFIFKICSLFISKKEAIFTTIGVGFISSFFTYSVVAYNNIVAIGFFFGGLYYLLKYYSKDKSIKNLILFSLFAGFATLVRYPIFLFYLPPIIIFNLKKQDKINIKNHLICLFVFILFILMLFSINKHLYGGVFSFDLKEGFSLVEHHDTLLETSFKEKLIILNNNIHDIFLKSFLFISILFMVSIFILIKNFIRKMKFSNKNKFYFSLLGIIILNILFYGTRIHSGYLNGSVSFGSYYRYMLISFILMVMFSFLIINQLNFKSKKFFLILFITFFIISQIILIYNASGGIKAYTSSISGFELKRQKLFEAIPENNSIIFTKYSDKLIFPEKISAIYSAIPEENQTYETAKIIKKLLTKGYPVYFLEEDWAERYGKISSKEFLYEFKENNLSYKEIKYWKWHFYKINFQKD